MTLKILYNVFVDNREGSAVSEGEGHEEGGGADDGRIKIPV